MRQKIAQHDMEAFYVQLAQDGYTAKVFADEANAILLTGLTRGMRPLNKPHLRIELDKIFRIHFGRSIRRRRDVPYFAERIHTMRFPG